MFLLGADNVTAHAAAYKKAQADVDDGVPPPCSRAPSQSTRDLPLGVVVADGPTARRGIRGPRARLFGYMAQIGRERNQPVVCDEGYVFWPPLRSEFEVSAVGRHWHEFIVDTMLAQDYWGVMVSSYAAPGVPMWEHRADWLMKVNDRITSTPPSWAG